MNSQKLVIITKITSADESQDLNTHVDVETEYQKDWDQYELDVLNHFEDYERKRTGEPPRDGNHTK
jgi:hypothetical protein